MNAVANWIPYKLFHQDGEPFCHWLNMQDKKFDEPFFDETLLHLKALPANTTLFKSVSSLQMVLDWSDDLAAAKPAAIIFHLSRCGSTLVSQLLALDETNIVLPEVPFFDEILRQPFHQPGIDEAITDKWLAAAIKFYGQQRREAEGKIFIKTDCWHIFFYKRLRQLFPGVPFVLLYRSPEEVLQSQQKRRGMQAVPGLVEPELMGLSKEEIDFNDFDGYFSNVMEKILEQFYRVFQNDPLTLLVNYKEGILPVVQKVAAVSGIAISPGLLNKMNERTRYHAKYPDQAFTKDKKPDTIPGCLQPAMDWYRRLEEIRKVSALPAAK
jgi:hypothetical protein